MPEATKMAHENCYIIVDIDGTLADNSHRVHHLEGENKDWKAYNSEMERDGLNEWCGTLVRKMDDAAWVNSLVVKTIYLTGREETYREVTIQWLRNYNLLRCSDDLYMRAKGDYRPDHVIKEEIYFSKILPRFANEPPLFVVDDRQQVVDMWRKLAITCLQCAQGDY